MVDVASYAGVPSNDVQYGTLIQTGLAGPSRVGDYPYAVYDQNGQMLTGADTIIPPGARISVGWPASSSTGGQVLTGTQIPLDAEFIRSSQFADQLALDTFNQQASQFQQQFGFNVEQANRQYEMDKAMLGEQQAARLLNTRIAEATMAFNDKKLALDAAYQNGQLGIAGGQLALDRELGTGQLDLAKRQQAFTEQQAITDAETEILQMLADRRGPQDWVAYNNLLSGLNRPNPTASQTIDVFSMLDNLKAQANGTAVPQQQPAAPGAPPTPQAQPAANPGAQQAQPQAPPVPAPAPQQPPAQAMPVGQPQQAAPPPQGGLGAAGGGLGNGVQGMQQLLQMMKFGQGYTPGNNFGPTPPQPKQNTVTIPMAEKGGVFGVQGDALGQSAIAARFAQPQMAQMMEGGGTPTIPIGTPQQAQTIAAPAQPAPQIAQTATPTATPATGQAARRAAQPPPPQPVKYVNGTPVYYSQAVDEGTLRAQMEARNGGAFNGGWVSTFERGGQMGGGEMAIVGDSSTGKPNEELVINLNPHPDDRIMVIPLDKLTGGAGQGTPKAETGGVYDAGLSTGNMTFNQYNPLDIGNQPFIQKLQGKRPSTVGGFGASPVNAALGIGPGDFPDTFNLADWQGMFPSERAQTESLAEQGLGVSFEDWMHRSRRLAPSGATLPVATYGQ